MSRLKMHSLERTGKMRQEWAGLRASTRSSGAGPCLVGESGQCPSLQAHAQRQAGGFSANPVWWIQPAHQGCHAERRYLCRSFNLASHPLSGRKEERFEKWGGRGGNWWWVIHSTINTRLQDDPLTCLHCGGILKAQWGSCSGPHLTPAKQADICPCRLCRTRLHHAPLFCLAIQIDSAALVFPPSQLPTCCFGQFPSGFNTLLFFELRAILS